MIPQRNLSFTERSGTWAGPKVEGLDQGAEQARETVRSAETARRENREVRPVAWGEGVDKDRGGCAWSSSWRLSCLAKFGMGVVFLVGVRAHQSSVPSMLPSMSRSSCRARLTLLLTVPSVQPQIRAVSS